MTPPTRLLKVGSMAGSMSIYLPAVAVQRVLAVARVFLFLHLLQKAEYGLWGLSAMIFTIGAPVVTLGTHLGLVRYVSFYEARGLLEKFYHRTKWTILAVVVCMTGMVMLASRDLTNLALVSHVQTDTGATSRLLQICWLALINAMLMGLYHSMHSFMIGMRVYRMVSAVELSYSVLFTVLGVGALLVERVVVSILYAHIAALGLTLFVGMVLLEMAVRYRSKAAQQETVSSTPIPEVPVLDSVTERVEVAPPVPLVIAAEDERFIGVEDAFRRVLRFGLVALLGNMLWLGTGYVSFWMTSRSRGPKEAGGFYAFLQLGQLILYLANAAWAVVFTHVARRWESRDRTVAMFTLQTSYKAVAMTVMTIALLVHATSKTWIRLLPEQYHQNLPLLPGLLMFFQVLTNLGLMTILVKIHRRPIVIVLLGLLGGGANAVLCGWWLPIYGPVGAAWAAGVGMYVGSGLVTLVYLLVTRVKLHASTLFVFASPVLLLLLGWQRWWWTVGALWVVVLGVGIATGWLFAQREKAILRGYVGRFITIMKRGRR